LLLVLTQNARALRTGWIPAREPGASGVETAQTLSGMDLPVCSQQLTFDGIQQ